MSCGVKYITLPALPPIFDPKVCVIVRVSLCSTKFHGHCIVSVNDTQHTPLGYLRIAPHSIIRANFRRVSERSGC